MILVARVTVVPTLWLQTLLNPDSIYTRLLHLASNKINDVNFLIKPFRGTPVIPLFVYFHS